MRRIFIFGLGYAASHAATTLTQQGWDVISTGRSGTLRFDDSGSVRLALTDASHVLSSVPPDGTGSDPVLDQYGDALDGKQLVYLSSTGVYGDTRGAWVDESAPIGTGRRTARSDADSRWLDRGAKVLRLPGIYGPGRSILERVARGGVNRIDEPGQVFSRIHVTDIASAIVLALDAEPGAYNVADDCPASQNDVIAEGCRLLGLPLPSIVPMAASGLSPAAMAFHAENRRIANRKARRVLGWRPRYPTYREGLAALLAARQGNDQAD